MNQFEILVTNCENNHTAPLYTDYEKLRPRSYTESTCDLLFAKSNAAAFTFNGVTANEGSEVSVDDGGTAGYCYTSTTRAPLLSRDPQTSSLDRCSPDCRPFYQHVHSPTVKKRSPKLHIKKVPFFSKLKKTRSKSAHSSPVHLAVQQTRPLNISAAIQDFGSSDPELGDQIESNLDFNGLHGGDAHCWSGSNESFSDLDRGMTRSSFLSPNSFRARSLSCSSYSQTDTELSRSNESIGQWASQIHSNNGAGTVYNSYCTCCALRKSCENVFAAAAKKLKSSPCRNGQSSKSSSGGGLIMQKFSKKLSKLNLGGGGGKSGEKSGGGLKKKKGRASSTSNLENPEG